MPGPWVGSFQTSLDHGQPILGLATCWRTPQVISRPGRILWLFAPGRWLGRCYLGRGTDTAFLRGHCTFLWAPRSWVGAGSAWRDPWGLGGGKAKWFFSITGPGTPGLEVGDEACTPGTGPWALSLETDLIQWGGLYRLVLPLPFSNSAPTPQAGRPTPSNRDGRITSDGVGWPAPSWGILVGRPSPRHLPTDPPCHGPAHPVPWLVLACPLPTHSGLCLFGSRSTLPGTVLSL